MSSLRKWADEHQYDAEPQLGATEHNGVMPSVHIIHMQDDPLGVLAAQNAIYKGVVKRSLAEVTDDERRQALEDMMRTTLQSPLEAIKIHFLFEGVDRSFTHQHVRQRTANFGQESMRFAVMGPLIDSTTLPPDLMGTDRSEMFFGMPDGLDGAHHCSISHLVNSNEFTYATEAQRNRAIWDWVIMNIDAAYHYLVEHGVAAEEARGLLPHCTATRIHYQTDLRGLMKVMGERLCTQAQFHWKIVAAMVRDAVRTYTPDLTFATVPGATRQFDYNYLLDKWEEHNRWQFELLADSGIFRPVCFQTGKCMFQASADRGCTIRERVEEFRKEGIPPEWWNDPEVVGNRRIRTEEWLMNPAAARETGRAS